jgi:hypothetical protein
MRTASVIGLALAGMLSCAAAAQQVASINLTGVKLQNGLNQSRTSAPAMISPAPGYRYEISGMVRGSSGLLALLYSSPISLADLLESLEPGSSALLAGYGCNGPATHPVMFLDQPLGGETQVGSITATVELDMRAGIDASNFAFFEMTNVVVTPSIVGSMTFVSGTVLINRVGCPADFNGDGALNLADFGAFQTGFALGDRRADYNCDGDLNLADFGAFQTGFAIGCP